MEKKGIKYIFVIISIISLLMADFIILGQGISIAIYEELEQQNIATNVKYVEFDAYFLNNGEQVHSKENKINSEDSLILNVNVKEKGVLNDAKIKISNANFEIIKDKVDNKFVKNIHLDTNEIELNQIIYQNNIKIQIPIKFKKEDAFSEDYFERENTISITGIYEDDKNQNVSGQINTRMIWKDETDVTLNQDIDKYINLGENGILLQQSVTTQVVDNKLPRESEKINIQVPTLDEQVPEEVTVLLNGEKLSNENIIYNKDEKSLEITKESKGVWGSKDNEYKVIYKYGEEVEFTEKTIALKTEINTKLYTCDNIEKQEEQTIEVNKTGSIVSINKEATDSVYKGFMYANVSNETNFQEYNYLEISDVSSVENIEIEEQEEFFTDEKENSFKINDNILYKATAVNTADFTRILGTEGEILIKDEDGNIINTINKDTQTDENGNLLITYDTEINNIKVTISKPINEGRLVIAHKRAIKGNTGYTKEQLKTFNKLVIQTKVADGLSEGTAQTQITLNDTKTEASIEIDNKNLSTLQSNEGVQLLITLKSNSAQYDLYKNPNIDVVLPKELKATIKKITQLNGENQLQIVNPKSYTNQNGEQVISLKMQGEQIAFENDINKGIQIAIIADISIDKDIPSQESKITMNYTNENAGDNILTTTADIKLNSKYGVLLVNQLSGYNQEQDIIENIDNEVQIAQLDMQAESRVATQEVAIVNNYEEAITNIAIIGKLPGVGEEKIENEIIETTFVTNLKQLISVDGAIATIYYSEDENATKDSDTWSKEINDITKIRAFKVELEENKIESKSVVKLSYNLEIPEALESNQTAYTSLSLEYDYAGNANNTNSGILLKTENATNEQLVVASELAEEVSVQLRGESAGEDLQEGQDVYEGQTIKYYLQITNNSEEDMKNINIEATYENAIFWDNIESTVTSSVTGEESIVTKYEENSELTSKLLTVENLSAGESVEVEYQISVKEVEDENQELTGALKINAENIDEQTINITPNKIKQSNLKLTLKEGFWEQTKIYSTGEYPIELEVKNIGDENLQDVVVEMPLPEELYFTLEQFAETDNIKFVEYKDKVVKFNIEQISKGETVVIKTQLIVEKFSTQEPEVSTSLLFNAKVNDEIYYSNQTTRSFYQSEADIRATQISDREEEYIETGDKITFITTIENKGVISKEISVNDNVPKGAVIKDAYILVDGEREEVEIISEYNSLYFNREISANQIIKLVISTEINTDYMLEDSITNYVTITGTKVKVTTNEITYKIKQNSDSDDSNSDDPNSDNPNDSNSDKEEVFNIGGVAWIDSNKNGYRETSEEKLNGIEVLLIDETTGNIATDKDGSKLTATTDEDGKYKFENVNKGSYTVIFKYDNGKYRVTGYQKEESPETANSDVISKNITLDGTEQEVAMTGTLKLEDEDLENIDAGFIQNEKFDLSLDKYINQIIIQNSNGTTVKQYEKSQLTKIELDSKQIANSIVIIEYNIRITNEGELSGYVNEIVDYMPSDLSFSSEMNKNWYQMSDGQLYSKELTDEIMNPGESKTVTLTLVKAMNQNNTGTTINTAEIDTASNDFSIQDIDSTPANKVSGEDDMSTAQVIISIRTGKAITYTLLILTIIAIVAIGVYLIKKKVITKNNN